MGWEIEINWTFSPNRKFDWSFSSNFFLFNLSFLIYPPIPPLQTLNSFSTHNFRFRFPLTFFIFTHSPFHFFYSFISFFPSSSVSIIFSFFFLFTVIHTGCSTTVFSLCSPTFPLYFFLLLAHFPFLSILSFHLYLFYAVSPSVLLHSSAWHTGAANLGSKFTALCTQKKKTTTKPVHLQILYYGTLKKLQLDNVYMVHNDTIASHAMCAGFHSAGFKAAGA